MKIKTCKCPACGASLDMNRNAAFNFCPHCGNRLHIPAREEAPQNPGLRQFVAADTGVPLASALIPPDYTLAGSLDGQWQCATVPFTTLVQAASPDRSIVLASSSRETFEEIQDPIQKRMVARIPAAAPAWLRDFMEPEAYLQQYAERMLGVPVIPVARTALPSAAGTPLHRALPNSSPMGSTVECSVVADHVYQNQYGDTIGVSGPAVDETVAARLNWTELKKE